MDLEHDHRTDADVETFNPWSIVNLVFEHLCDHALHPTFGEGGDPAVAAAALLRALSIQPEAEGNREVMRAVHVHLAELRAAVLDDPEANATVVSQ